MSRRATHRALLALSGLAAAGLIVGCSSTVSGDGSFDEGDRTTSTTTKSTRTSTTSRDFPTPTPTNTRTTDSTTGRTSTPTPTNTRTAGSTTATRTPTSSTTALQTELAAMATSWMHSYASGDEATFCSLSDPVTLQQVFDEKSIASCADLNIDWTDDPELQAKLAAFAIPNPSRIVVSASSASITASNVSPSGMPGMKWVKTADGTWKVDASILLG